MAEEEFEESIISEDLEQLPLFNEELKNRCQAAKISVEEKEDSTGNKYLSLEMPSGRSKRTINLFRSEDIHRLVSIQFEKYIFLSDYDAICSYSDGTIEAGIRPLGQLMPTSSIYERLVGPEARNRQTRALNIDKLNIEIRPAEGSTNELIRIGPLSDELRVLGRRRSSYVPPPSIKISGLNVSRHDQAVDYLERISNSLFLEIDLTYNLPITLIRERPMQRSGTISANRSGQRSLQFPKCEYDPEPVSLYWYARSARGMPLLQFLAFYQSIEFYFPIYSQLDAQRRVKNILKDPSFNPHRDADVGRLLGVMKANGGRGYGDERSQLRAALQECLNPDALRAFLTEDEGRRDFFSSKQKVIDAHRLPVANPEADLRNDVADRIYDIRCKIVHTKNTGGNGELDLLLPFSKEAESLIYDIELIQYISQQVLIAGSGPLRHLG